MKTPVLFASRIRLHAVLYGAAVLLSACGGAADDRKGQQLLAADTVASPVAGATNTAPGDVAALTDASVNGAGTMAPVTASHTDTGAAAPEPAAPVAAPAVSADTSVAANPAAASGAPAANFDLSGYQPADPAAGAEAVQAPQAPH
jgi:hypothetical protein